MKLVYKNNWEADEYYVGNRRLKTLSKVRIAGRDYTVKSRIVSVPYHDMGHMYNAQSTHYFVKEKVFGKMVEFDLNSVKVPIMVLKYTLEDDDDYQQQK